MAPKSETNIFVSSLGLKHMPNRDEILKDGESWLNDKKTLDGAEGLWRIHDGLYDFTDFIKNHPGGDFWLDTTKGTDITEAFECHHISTLPEYLLNNYFVRKATTPRYYPFTFEDNGFYRTLKRKVRIAMKTLPSNLGSTSNRITDTLFILSLIFVTAAFKYRSYYVGVIAALIASLLDVAAHNYYHKRDNFRMHYGDIYMSFAREWRIIHVLSHHMYPNTTADLQAYGVEPIGYLYPHAKSVLKKYGSWICVPFLLWPLLFPIGYFKKLYSILKENKFGKITDCFPLLLPLIMYIFTGQTLTDVIKMWFFIITVNSFCFCINGFTATHYHPDIFMDGDAPRSKNETDWGIIQLDTVGERPEIRGNHFLTMVTFGDHALHHLFPTLDHEILPYLYPIAEETMRKYNLDFNFVSQTDMMKGYFRQLKKETPNRLSPSQMKK